EMAVCVLTNLGYNGNDSVNSWGLCLEIAKILNMNAFVDRNYVKEKGMTIIPFKPNTLKHLVGKYEIMGNTVLIFLRDEKVLIQAPFGEFELVQLDTGEFIFLGAN